MLARAGRYHRVADNLEAKEVLVAGRRYVVWRNAAEAKKDAAARTAILAKLEATLAQGPKAVVGNKGFGRFLRGARGSATIDRAAVGAVHDEAHEPERSEPALAFVG